VIGYCMGGTLALCAIAAGRLAPRSLVALATPVAFDQAGLLAQWCRTPGFDPEALAGLSGNVPPHLLQPAFKMLDPIGLATKLIHLDPKLGDDEFVRFFLAMETWLEDSVAFPGQAFVEWVRLYRTDALIRGALRLDGVRIDLGRVRCPVRNVVAESDYITPPAAAEPLGRYLGGSHELVRVRGGHIGLSTGSDAHRHLWPEIAAWMHSHHGLMHTHQKKQPATRTHTQTQARTRTKTKTRTRTRTRNQERTPERTAPRKVRP
jgi:polyhydroxyalkanoate synthase